MVTYIAIAVIVAVAAILIYRKTRKKEEKDMPAGLQVFNENGILIVDMQSRISKVLGEVTISTRKGSLTDTRLLDGTMWYAVTKIGDGDYAALEVKANGSTLSWTQRFCNVAGESFDTPNDITFVYGIY